jgi:Flp pilus assembly protein TadD
MAAVRIATSKRCLVLLVVVLTGACGSILDDAKRAPSDAADAATLIRVADRMRAEGAIEPALNIYRKAEAAAPSQAGPKIGEGEALLALGSYGQAGEAFSAALRQAPRNPNALRGLALALMRNGQPGLALEPLVRLAAVAPDEARTYSLAGIARDLMGDHAGAQARYRAGLARVAGQPGLATNLALSLALTGDFAGAVAVLRPLADRPDATSRLRQNLALVYGLAGDTENAARLGRFDLDEASVATNLASYQRLRTLPPQERTRALLIGGARADNVEPAS